MYYTSIFLKMSKHYFKKYITKRKIYIILTIIEGSCLYTNISQSPVALKSKKPKIVKKNRKDDSMIDIYLRLFSNNLAYNKLVSTFIYVSDHLLQYFNMNNICRRAYFRESSSHVLEEQKKNKLFKQNKQI